MRTSLTCVKLVPLWPQDPATSTRKKGPGNIGGGCGQFEHERNCKTTERLKIKNRTKEVRQFINFCLIYFDTEQTKNPRVVSDNLFFICWEIVVRWIWWMPTGTINMRQTKLPSHLFTLSELQQKILFKSKKWTKERLDASKVTKMFGKLRYTCNKLMTECYDESLCLTRLK